MFTRKAVRRGWTSGSILFVGLQGSSFSNNVNILCLEVVTSWTEGSLGKMSWRVDRGSFSRKDCWVFNRKRFRGWTGVPFSGSTVRCSPRKWSGEGGQGIHSLGRTAGCSTGRGSGVDRGSIL